MNNFTCSFCGLKKELKELAGELKKPSEKLLAEKTRLEAEMVKISSLRISTADQEQKAELERKEERIIKELTDLTQIIKNKKENTCAHISFGIKFCIVFFTSSVMTRTFFISYIITKN